MEGNRRSTGRVGRLLSIMLVTLTLAAGASYLSPRASAGIGNAQATLASPPSPANSCYIAGVGSGCTGTGLGMNSGLLSYLDKMFKDSEWSVLTRPATATGTEQDRHGFVPTSDPRYVDGGEYTTIGPGGTYMEFGRDTSYAMLYATLTGKKYGSYQSSTGYYGGTDWTKRVLDFYLNSTSNTDFTYTAYTWNRPKPGEVCGTVTSLNCAYTNDLNLPAKPFDWAPILVYPITDTADSGTNNQWSSPLAGTALTFDATNYVSIAQRFQPNFATATPITLQAGQVTGWSTGPDPTSATNPADPPLVAPAGSQVTLTLISKDTDPTVKHQFWIDFNNNGVKDIGEYSSDFWYGSSTIFSFSTPSTPGSSYTYYDGYFQGNKGVFIVEAHGFGRVDLYAKGATTSGDLTVEIYPACTGTPGSDIDHGTPIFTSYVPASALQGQATLTMLWAYNTYLRRGFCGSTEASSDWIVASSSTSGTTGWGERNTDPAPSGYESYSKNSQGTWTLNKDSQNNNLWMGFNSYASGQLPPPGGGRETDVTFHLALAWADYVHRHRMDAGVTGWASYTYQNILSKWINHFLQWSGKATKTCPTPTYQDTWNCKLKLILNTHLEQQPTAHAYDIRSNVLAWRAMRKLVVGEDGYSGVLQELGLVDAVKCSNCYADANSFPEFVSNLMAGITSNLVMNSPGGQPVWKLAANRIRSDNTLEPWPYEDSAVDLYATTVNGKAAWGTSALALNNPTVATNVGYGQIRPHFALVSNDGNTYNLWINVDGDNPPVQDLGETSGPFNNLPSHLTLALSAGQNSFTVSSTIGFSVGEQIQIGDGRGLDIGTISSISGSTITLAANVVNNHAINENVYKSWSPTWVFDNVAFGGLNSQGLRTFGYSDTYTGGGGTWSLTSLPYSEFSLTPFLFGDNQFDEARDHNTYSDWKARQFVTWAGTVEPGGYNVINQGPAGMNNVNSNTFGKSLAYEMMVNWYFNDKTTLKSNLEFLGDYHGGKAECEHATQLLAPNPANSKLSPQLRLLFPEGQILSDYENMPYLSTTLTQAVSQGATTLTVASSSGFNKNDEIQIDSLASGSAEITYVSQQPTSSTSFSISPATAFGHGGNAIVVRCSPSQATNDWSHDSGNMEQTASFLLAMYYLNSPKLSSNFDVNNCSLSPWTAVSGNGGTIAVSTTRYYSSPCSLFVSYSGRAQTQAVSPAVNYDRTKDYSIIIQFYVPSTQTFSDRYMVIIDDSRSVVDYSFGIVYAGLIYGSGLTITAMSRDQWHTIEVRVYPSVTGYDVLVDGTLYNNGGNHYPFYASGTATSVTVGSRTTPGKREYCDAYWDDVQVLPWIA